MSPKLKITIRLAITYAVFVIAFFALLIELAKLMPEWLAHPPNDYGIYVQWGMAERLGSGTYTFALPNYYPRPTTLWIFVPLSILPNWFALLWTIVPLFFTLWLFKRPGVILWLYYPMLVQAATGQMDGWLLLPILWLVENRPWFAGIGAALVLFKPQLGFATVLFALIFWFFKKDVRNLAAFASALCVLYLPAFITNPLWLPEMIDNMQVRANESILPTRGASLWAWAWHGGITLWLLPIVITVALVLVVYAFFVRGKRFQAVQLLGLLIMPVLYASNFVTIIPLVKSSRQIVILTLASWGAVVIDTLAGGWGGAYALIPLTALYLLARDNEQKVIPPIPTTQIAR